MPGNNYIRLTGLFQIHKHVKDLSHAPGWHYYLGAGGHMAYYANANITESATSEKEYINYFAFGLDIALGIEHMWVDFPFTFGIEVKPYYSIATNKLAPKNHFNAAVCVRHIIL